jgi:hypothetical protein
LASLFGPDAYFTNQSINGLVSRLVRSTDRTLAPWPNAFDPSLPMLVLTGLFALGTGIVLWRSRSTLAGRRGIAIALGIALTAGLIGAPKGAYWTQALALLAVGLLLAVDAPDLRLDRFGRTDRALFAAWFLGAVVQAILWLAPPPKTVPLAPLVTLATSASAVGMFALWWLLVRRLGDERLPDPWRPTFMATKMEPPEPPPV